MSSEVALYLTVGLDASGHVIESFGVDIEKSKILWDGQEATYRRKQTSDANHEKNTRALLAKGAKHKASQKKLNVFARMLVAHRFKIAESSDHFADTLAACRYWDKGNKALFYLCGFDPMEGRCRISDFFDGVEHGFNSEVLPSENIEVYIRSPNNASAVPAAESDLKQIVEQIDLRTGAPRPVSNNSSTVAMKTGSAQTHPDDAIAADDQSTPRGSISNHDDGPPKTGRPGGGDHARTQISEPAAQPGSVDAVSPQAQSKLGKPASKVWGACLAGLVATVGIILIVAKLLPGEVPASIETDAPAVSATTLAAIVLETQRITRDQMLNENTPRFTMVLNQNLGGLAPQETQQYQNATSEQAVRIEENDLIIRARQSAFTNDVAAVNLKIDGVPEGTPFFWMKLPLSGRGQVVRGSFNQRRVTVNAAAGLFELLVVIKGAADNPGINPDDIRITAVAAPVLLVPAYFYPDSPTLKSDEWQKFRDLVVAVRGHAQVYAVLNVDSGAVRRAAETLLPTTEPNPDYAALVEELQQWQVPWVGYITYGYGKPRTLTDKSGRIHEVSREDDLACWLSSYPGMHGVFMDEVPTDPSHTDGLRRLCGTIRKALQAAHISHPVIIGNPGTMCPPELASDEIFNWLCIDERTTQKSDFTRLKIASDEIRFGSLLHSATDAKQIPVVLETLRKRDADFFFVTDQSKAVDGDVWTKMPRQEVIDELVKFVNSP